MRDTSQFENGAGAPAFRRATTKDAIRGARTVSRLPADGLCGRACWRRSTVARAATPARRARYGRPSWALAWESP